MTYAPHGEPVQAGGTDDRLLPWNRVRDIAGISRSTAWRMQQIGAFPAPVPVSPGRVGWWVSELDAWKTTRARGEGGMKPMRPPRGPQNAKPQRSPRLAKADKPASVQPSLHLGSSAAAAAKRPIRRRAVSSDQIDFGF